jgi:hypothetical protein
MWTAVLPLLGVVLGATIRIAVSLSKIANGKPVSDDAMPDAVEVKCPRCVQTYRLGYS